MHRGLWAALGGSLLVCLVMAGCGSSGGSSALQPVGPDTSASAKRAIAIPRPGTVLTERKVDWAALYPGMVSRSADSALTLGNMSASVAPVSSSVPIERINLFSVVVPSWQVPVVWTMRPVPNAAQDMSDSDLGIYTYASGVFASSSHVGDVEEWVAYDPPSYSGRQMGIVYAAPDGVPTHAFVIEADRGNPISVNGAAKTGRDSVLGSDWFYFNPPYNPSTGTYEPVTVTVTALGGDDPDLYLYDSVNRQGSAPVAASVNVGDDWVSYTSTYGWRLWARVYAASAAAAPCDYRIRVTSP